MAQDITPRLAGPRRRLSRPAQLVLMAVLLLGLGIGIVEWRAADKPVADRAESVQPARLATSPGTFRPTAPQWAGLKFETVKTMAFRPERVTEGSIATTTI